MAYSVPVHATEHIQAQTQAHALAQGQTWRIVTDRRGDWTASHAWQQSLSHDVSYLRHSHDVVHSDGARVVWAAWSLPDAITQQLPVWLGVHLPAWAEVQLWIRWNQGEWQLLALEHDQRVAQSGEGHILPVWAIHDSTWRQIDVLVRIEHLTVFQLPLVLLKPELFMRAHGESFLFVGCLLALLLLNVYVMFQARHAHLRRQLLVEMCHHRWFEVAQHDLWQPLKSVQLYAHALEQASPGQQVRLLKGMQLAVQHVEDFMQHLRLWSEQHPGYMHRQAQHQFMTADALLSPLVTECMPLAHWHRVSLHYRKNESRLRVDAPAVQRMLRNLIHNALSYTPAGGRVLIGCRRQAGYLWILCADNGRGMTAEQLTLCTQAYRRFESSGGHLEHQGLGLFSFSQLAKQMKLPMRISSTPGRGSMFGFAIPLA